MNSHWGSAPDTSLADYFSRNARWLRPAAGALVAIAAPTLAVHVAPSAAAQIPSWAIPTATVLGALGVSLGAFLTDTTSAAVIRVVGLGAAIGSLLYFVFR